MRESRTYGSVRGALSNERPYRDRSARNDGSPRRRGACHQVRVRATRWLAMTATAIDRFAERDEIERRRYGTLMRSQPARS